MGGRYGLAALVAASLGIMPSAQAGDFESSPATPGLTFETSARARLAWTEIAFRSNRPKAWDEISSPELRASLRLLSGLFEGKIELGAFADRYDHFESVDTDSLRAEVQFGINTGPWSALAEWKPRDVFQPGIGDFVVGLEMYDLRLRDRFALTMRDSWRPSQVQASFAAGYVASTPDLYRRKFAEFELELVQRFDGGLAFTVAPKLELSDYADFPGGKREDAAVSVRLIPAYEFGGGLSVSVEGQATIAFSTRDTKTGETWALTPILRLQKAL